MIDSSKPMPPWVRRLIRAANLEPKFYEEIKIDRGCLGQAGGAVALAALASALGGGMGYGFFAFVVLFVCYPLSWIVWSLVIHGIARASGSKEPFQTLLRMTGFAFAPGAAGVLGCIPLAGIAVFLAVWIWTALAVCMAVRHAYGYAEGPRAAAVTAAGWLAQAAACIVVIYLLAVYSRTAG